ncbi:MAG: response regulator, partial [Lachnospiraceae bacterium]|nr:response regulator [Lachnospiraceae bacterium]
AFIYTVYFDIIVFFYPDIKVFWIFTVCPLLLTALYRDYRRILTTLLVSFMGMMALLAHSHYVDDGFRIESPPWLMMSAEAFIVALIVGSLAVVLHTRIEQAISDVTKAEALQQAKDSFFAKMSHEIRTPINAVLGMDEMILRENISPEVTEYALNIRNAGQNLLSMINDILDSSKLEAGKLEIVPIDYDVMRVLEDCYNLVNIRAKEKGLELKVTNDPSVPRKLFGDELRVRQIITNLLTNAVKYTKTGFVELGIRWQKLDGDEMNLIISVKDTGVGISKEGLERLFESYDRLDEGKNKYVEGTGLGLSICKQLVEMMNGKIKVDSEENVGSTFTVTLPQTIVGVSALGDFYKNLASSLKTSEEYKEKFRAPDTHILVVDDVKMNVDVFKGLLKRTQIQIDDALSGSEALFLLKNNKYDIVFLDHLMPNMDGVETLKKLRSMDTPNNNTPVIVLTANVGRNIQEEYSNWGFDDYISKPVKGRVLEETVYKYLNNKLVSADTSKEEAPAKPKNSAEEFLNKLKFLDTKMGLSCCADDLALYKDILNDYLNDSRLEELNELYNKKDWKNYIVDAHGLKSASLSIGAMSLSEEA